MEKYFVKIALHIVTKDYHPDKVMYENTRVVCDTCGKEIMTDDLDSDSYYDGEDERYSDRVCPHCGEYDCCNLEYESLTDALKRAGKY